MSWWLILVVAEVVLGYVIYEILDEHDHDGGPFDGYQ